MFVPESLFVLSRLKCSRLHYFSIHFICAIQFNNQKIEEIFCVKTHSILEFFHKKTEKLFTCAHNCNSEFDSFCICTYTLNIVIGGKHERHTNTNNNKMTKILKHDHFHLNTLVRTQSITKTEIRMFFLRRHALRCTALCVLCLSAILCVCAA